MNRREVFCAIESGAAGRIVKAAGPVSVSSGSSGQASGGAFGQPVSVPPVEPTRQPNMITVVTSIYAEEGDDECPGMIVMETMDVELPDGARVPDWPTRSDITKELAELIAYLSAERQ